MRRAALLVGFVSSMACKTESDPAVEAECAPRTFDEAAPLQAGSAVADAPVDRPPLARRQDVKDTLHGVVVPDPYRWLEDEKDPEVQAWMTAQDQWARAQLGQLPGRDAIRDRLTELMYVGHRNAPTIRGENWFFATKGATEERWTYKVSKGADGEAKVLLGEDELGTDGSIAVKGTSPSPDGTRWAYKLSENNADAATLYIRDVATGKNLPDVLKGARYASPSWLPDGSGFYYTGLPDDPSIPPAEMPGRAEVRFHTIGTPQSEDAVVYPALHDPTTFIGASVSLDGRWLVLDISRGFDSNDVWVADLQGRDDHGAKDAFVPAVVGEKHHYAAWVSGGQLLVQTDDGAERSRLMVADPAQPGREHWRELVGQREGTLESASVRGGRLVLRYLDKAHSVIRIHERDGSFVREVELPGLGSAGGFVGHPDQDLAFVSYSSYTEPPRIYQTSMADGGLSVFHAPKLPFSGETMQTEQVWIPSKDGTKVSAFVVSNKGIARDGSHPVLLYGYGGFSVSLTPSFSATAVTWIEQGGVYVVANLRGGGEYGEAWHQAGKGSRKQNTFDDFIAVAQWLVDSGYTKPGGIAIQGGSNGGLLVGATATQAPPGLLGAVLCGVPLLDMIRYHKFGSGPTWISEYGSADDPEQFETLWAYSPYHRIDGQTLPPLLMLASDHDDRVDPMHARKFVAAAQHTGTEAWLRVEKNAGHGGADLVRSTVDRTADSLAFARWALSAER